MQKIFDSKKPLYEKLTNDFPNYLNMDDSKKIDKIIWYIEFFKNIIDIKYHYDSKDIKKSQNINYFIQSTFIYI